MKPLKGAILLLQILFIAIIEADISPQTNCLFHNQNRLFMLLDLKGREPYLLKTAQNDEVYFNFCDAFTLPQCGNTQNYLAYAIINSTKICYPLTSDHSGRFQTQYGYDQSYRQNVLSLAYHKDYVGMNNYELEIKIVCSDKQLQVEHLMIEGSQIEVALRSIHGCPVYQAPPMMSIIDQYNLVIAIFAFFTGFLFLFYGRVMIHITAYLSMSTTLILCLTYLCFLFMEQSIDEFYLYLTLAIILISSFVASYFFTKFFVEASLFFIGAEFGFFAGVFIKAFVLTYIADVPQLLFLVNGLMNFVTVGIMVLLGSLTLEHKQYVIIYSTTATGSYSLVRGISLLIGGFPCEFEILELVEAKQISSIPISFFIYLLVIVLLGTIGGIYQQLQFFFYDRKLQKERNSESQNRSSLTSGRFSSYIEGNLDQIHTQLDRIIDRYRNSRAFYRENIHEESSQQMDRYQKLKEKQQNK